MWRKGLIFATRNVESEMIDKSKVRASVLDYAGILLGCLIVSVAFVTFITPYKLVPGGMFGASIVLHNLFPALGVGTFGYILGVPLLVMSYLLIGKGVGARTLVATLVTPSLMNLMTHLAYRTPEALRSLSPSLLWGGHVDCSHDLILSVVIGSVLIGVGEGIMVRCKATSGGSDTVAMLLHKYLGVRFSHALISVDASVIAFGLVVIGFGLGTETPAANAWLLSGYSLICCFLMSTTVARVIAGPKSNKLMLVISDEERSEAVREFIIHEFDRTATVVPSRGLYSKLSKVTLLMVVRLREVDRFTTRIQQIDPAAFVIVTDAYDAYGLRWKAFPDADTLQIN